MLLLLLCFIFIIIITIIIVFYDVWYVVRVCARGGRSDWRCACGREPPSTLSSKRAAAGWSRPPFPRPPPANAERLSSHKDRGRVVRAMVSGWGGMARRVPARARPTGGRPESTEFRSLASHVSRRPVNDDHDRSPSRYRRTRIARAFSRAESRDFSLPLSRARAAPSPVRRSQCVSSRRLRVCFRRGYRFVVGKSFATEDSRTRSEDPFETADPGEHSDR